MINFDGVFRLILMLTSTFFYGQNSIKTIPIDSLVIKADQIAGIDNFGTIYFTVGAQLIKRQKDKVDLPYSNVQLGFPTTVNTFNPLKINMFYQDFNTVIILDNRLAEIFKVDFNTKQPYKNVSHVSTGFDNTLWIFNQDLQRLELYDYKTDNMRATTIPVQSNVLDLKSDYNYCWMLTEKFLYQYTYIGSLITKIKNNGYTKLALENENLILKSNSGLLYKSAKGEELIPIKTDEMLINQFLLTNETLYIYDLKTLHKLQLKIK